jgi:hypothetical protein
MQINNFKHPGKTTTRRTGKNYMVQADNAPTEAELTAALADVVEAAADEVEAKLRAAGLLP